MSREQDDDALSWAGEESDPTLETVVPRSGAGSTKTPLRGVEDAAKSDLTAKESTDIDQESSASSALLVTMGIAAGVYLLYTIGWIITGTRQNALIPDIAGDVVGQFMYGLGLWLAAAAPVVWFTGVLLIARKRRAGVRILWLVVGAILLMPVPFVMGA